MRYYYYYHLVPRPDTWTLGCYGDPTTPVTVATCETLYDGCTNGETTTVYTEEYPDGSEQKMFCPCYESADIDGCDSGSKSTNIANSDIDTTTNGEGVGETTSTSSATTTSRGAAFVSGVLGSVS